MSSDLSIPMKVIYFVKDPRKIAKDLKLVSNFNPFFFFFFLNWTN